MPFRSLARLLCSVFFLVQLLQAATITVDVTSIQDIELSCSWSYYAPMDGQDSETSSCGEEYLSYPFSLEPPVLPPGSTVTRATSWVSLFSSGFQTSSSEDGGPLQENCSDPDTGEFFPCPFSLGHKSYEFVQPYLDAHWPSDAQALAAVLSGRSLDFWFGGTTGWQSGYGDTQGFNSVTSSTLTATGTIWATAYLTVDYEPAAIPEASTWSLVGLGLFAAAGARRFRRG